MKKSVTLRLDRFGQEALDEYVQGTKGSHVTVLRTAVSYYLGDADSGRAAWRVPQLAREATFARTLELELDEDLHQRLEEEARRQDVPVDLLAAHAVIYFLTDLDTGRAAARLGAALDRDAEAE
jgi:predicted transcriptional regulator